MQGGQCIRADTPSPAPPLAQGWAWRAGWVSMDIRGSPAQKAPLRGRSKHRACGLTIGAQLPSKQTGCELVPQGGGRLNNEIGMRHCEAEGQVYGGAGQQGQ